MWMFTASQSSTVNDGKNVNIGDWINLQGTNCCTEMRPAKMVSSSAKKLREDRINPPIRTE